MTELAVIRPDEWNLPLFLHVLGAFTLVGALVTSASFLFAGHRGSFAFTRLGYRALLFGALPAYVATRVGAEWIASKEGVDDSDLAWVTIGYISTDIGLLALIAATVAAGLTVRRARRAGVEGDIGRGAAVGAWLTALLVVVYAVVIWVMATKPA
jgi:hypothetical protein